jgi:hypothetical protein
MAVNRMANARDMGEVCRHMIFTLLLHANLDPAIPRVVDAIGWLGL